MQFKNINRQPQVVEKKITIGDSECTLWVKEGDYDFGIKQQAIYYFVEDVKDRWPELNVLWLSQVEKWENITDDNNNPIPFSLANLVTLVRDNPEFEVMVRKALLEVLQPERTISEKN